MTRNGLQKIAILITLLAGQSSVFGQQDGQTTQEVNQGQKLFFTTIDGPPGSIWTQLDHINFAGQAVGWYQDADAFSHGLLWRKGTLTTIDPPGSTFTDALIIGSNDHVAGHYQDGSGDHGFIWDKSAFTRLDAPGATSTNPTAMNSTGWIVGTYLDDSNNTHAFLWRKLKGKGVFTNLDLPGAVYTEPKTIHADQIAGYYSDSNDKTHGFLRIWRKGTTTLLDVPGAAHTYPMDINQYG